MDFNFDQTTDNELDLSLPTTIYTPQDTQENAGPSLPFASGELGDLSLFPKMPPFQTGDWSLETFGGVYDGPHVHEDGHMDNAMHPPEYYVYSPPRDDTWEDGLQVIEYFDWSVPEEVEDVRRTPEVSETVPASRAVSEAVEDIRKAPEVAETVSISHAERTQANTPEGHSTDRPEEQQATHPQLQRLADEYARDAIVATPHLLEHPGVPLEVGHVEEEPTLQDTFTEPEANPAATPEQESSQDIDIVDAEALDQSTPARSPPVLASPWPAPDLAIEHSAEIDEPVLLSIKDAELAPADPARSSDDLPTSTNALEEVADDTPVARSTASPTPLPPLKPFLPASPSPTPTNTGEDFSQVACDLPIWEAQLQEAAAEASPMGLFDLFPPGAQEQSEGADGGEQQLSMKVDDNDTDVQSDALPSVLSVNEISIADRTASPHSQGRALARIASEEERFVDVNPSPVADTDTRNRTKPVFARESSDTEADAPEKKKIKTRSETPDSNAEAADTSAVPPGLGSIAVSSKKPRPNARKSVKESAREMVDDVKEQVQQRAVSHIPASCTSCNCQLTPRSSQLPNSANSLPNPHPQKSISKKTPDPPPLPTMTSPDHTSTTPKRSNSATYTTPLRLHIPALHAPQYPTANSKPSAPLSLPVCTSACNSHSTSSACARRLRLCLGTRMLTICS